MNVEKKPDTSSEPAIKDVFYLSHILFFILGVLHFVPLTFFTIENEYWMYKFRNTDIPFENGNSENRTTLQSEFNAANGVCITISLFVGMVVTTAYGFKISIKTRVIGSLLVMLLCFILGIILINVDTDSWQVGFFVLSIAQISVLNIFNGVMGGSLYELVAKFPKVYLQTYLTGEGIAGIFNAVLLVACTAMGTHRDASALIYFVIGALLFVITLAMFIVTRRTKFYIHQITINKDTEVNKKPPKFAEIKKIVLNTKVVIYLFIIIGLVVYVGKGSIAPLVVSEYQGVNKWGDSYFVPTVTFLISGISEFFGRSVATALKKTPSKTVLSIAATLLLLVLVPLFYFCNAQPRSHLPVLFEHDYQFAIILICFCFIHGYFLNVVFYIMRKDAPPEELQKTFQVISSFAVIFGCVTSFLGLAAVKVL